MLVNSIDLEAFSHILPTLTVATELCGESEVNVLNIFNKHRTFLSMWQQ